MASNATPDGRPLPAGWTYHCLNGRPFYYHRATNTTQQDPPACGGSFEMTAPVPDAVAMYPEPQPEPARFSAEVQMLPQMSAPLLQQPQATAPIPVAHAPLPPALQVQPGVYSSLVPQVAAPPAPVVTPTPPLLAQPVQTPVTQPMVSLQVLVPEPGLRAGQQLAFTAPNAGPNGQPQQMTVTVNQEVVPGSTVTVQYSAPHASLQASPSLPQQTVQVDPREDERQSKKLWALYGAGMFCACCFFLPFGLLIWVVACSMHFCKPANVRSQYRQARLPACFSALTCLAFILMATIMIPIVVTSPEFQDQMHHLKHDMHHWRHGLKHGHGHHHGHHHHDWRPEHDEAFRVKDLNGDMIRVDDANEELMSTLKEIKGTNKRLAEEVQKETEELSTPPKLRGWM